MSRLGGRWLNQLKCWLGLPTQRRLARAALLVGPIRAYEASFTDCSDGDLLERSRKLRVRARGGEPLDELLPEAFGLVSEAARRTIGLRPFDVQLAGGVVLHHGGLAELATGEGKTLVAVLPAYLNALTGKGVHVTTVNDYLARRDCEWLRPVYEALGLTVAALQQEMPDEERRRAYQCDITYGMASEFGFDFLRDRLKLRRQGPAGKPFWSGWLADEGPRILLEPPVQRGHHFALVDEADSILIDEARTPLVISTPTRRAAPEEEAVYLWADRVARGLDSRRHFALDPRKGKAELTEEGRRQVRWSEPPSGPHARAMDRLYERIERALEARHRFRRDQHYLLDDDKVVIIDEYTGRRMPDRHWQDGLHQAVEAKEQAPVTVPANPAAQITFQRYFRLYTKLAGMTGTAAPNRREFRRVYRLPVMTVPTNRPVVRAQWPDRVFATETEKFAAVVEDVQRLVALGRPVLIGTRSVAKSERLSALLKEAGIDHQVLNARQHATEADVVARAGEAGRVTIATNMAGRGTDIRLGPGVPELGGLHVIATERHDAARIDRQLAGRAGRQGDPGSCQFFLSLEDELLDALGPAWQAYLRDMTAEDLGDGRGWAGLFRRAQRRTERRHYRQRVDLMFYERRRQETLKELGADPYVD